MLTNGRLAEFSDSLMLSAITVYVLAMLTYAAAAALRTRVRAPASSGAWAVSLLTLGDGTPSEASLAPPMSSPDSGGRPFERVGRVAVSLTVLAFGLHLATVVARTVAVGRAPWGNMYEFLTTGALAAAATYLLLLRHQPVQDLGAWIVGLVVLALGLSVTVLYTPAGDLVPALNSYWLVLHVAAAVICAGVFSVGAIAAVFYLVRLRADRSPGRRSRFAGRLPAIETLDRVAHFAHLFAFPVWTFAVLAGAVWAENALGRYWGWDPKETWAFVTWVLYAAYLHAQATPGWRGRRATWFALAGYLAFVFNFFGVNIWITGLHSYAGI